MKFDIHALSSKLNKVDTELKNIDLDDNIENNIENCDENVCCCN